MWGNAVRSLVTKPIAARGVSTVSGKTTNLTLKIDEKSKYSWKKIIFHF